LSKDLLKKQRIDFIAQRFIRKRFCISTIARTEPLYGFLDKGIGSCKASVLGVNYRDDIPHH